MGMFDFLDNIGDSKANYKTIDVGKNLKNKIEYLELLQNRNLIMGQFKDELLELYQNKKLSDEQFYFNVNKSISLHEKVELKFISLDDNMFKLKNDTFEYVGRLDKMTDSKSSINKNSGCVSYSFASQLNQHLKNKILSIKQINDLSDILDFKVLKIFNTEQTNMPEG
jgi:hypothetical protein